MPSLLLVFYLVSIKFSIVLSSLYIYMGVFQSKMKNSKKKIIIKLLPWQWLDFFDSTHCPIQHNFQHFIIFYYSIIFPHQTLLLLIFNYFFLFIFNHTRLQSSRFLHFILLNFITSSSTLLHLCFAFLLIRNFCVFYQYQCGSASSQVLSLKFLNTIFFNQYRYLCSFLFFSFEVIWFTKCKFVLVLRTIFFF